MNGASFWRRYAAWSLDAALIFLPIVLLFWPLMRHVGATMSADYASFLRQAGRSLLKAYTNDATPMDLVDSWLTSPDMMLSIDALQASFFALLWPMTLAFAVLGALYHVGFETSLRQATPGQRALGLRVIAVAGLRLDAQRALWRHLAGALSWLTLNVGHAMALLPDRVALHDRLSATRVVQLRRDMPLPLWAKGWLALQIVAMLWLTVAFVQVTDAGLQKGLDVLG